MTNASIDPKLWEQYKKRADVALWIKHASRHAKRVFSDGYAYGIAAAHAVAQAQPVAPATGEDLQVYGSIADSYFKDTEHPRAVELPEPDMVTKTAPETIYLCVSDEPEDANLPFDEGGIYVDEGITWSRGKPIACCVEYVRADQVHHLLAAERQKYEDVLTLARKALKECRKELYEWMADHGQDTATQEARAKAISAIAAIDKLKEGA